MTGNGEQNSTPTKGVLAIQQEEEALRLLLEAIADAGAGYIMLAGDVTKADVADAQAAVARLADALDLGEVEWTDSRSLELVRARRTLVLAGESGS